MDTKQPIPSYSESQQQLANRSFRKAPARQNRDAMNAERASQMNQLLLDHICPAVYSSDFFTGGTGHFSLILLPSDVNVAAVKLERSTVTLPTLPPDVEVKIVNLQPVATERRGFTSSALSEQTALTFLAQQLLNTLIVPEGESQQQSASDQKGPSPHDEEPPAYTVTPSHSSSPTPKATQAPLPNLPPRPTVQARLSQGTSTFLKQYLMRKLPNMAKVPPTFDPTGTTSAWNLGWRTESLPHVNNESVKLTARASADPSLEEEAISVEAGMRNLSLRWENEMGLYESASCRALWINIRAESQPS